LIEVKNTTISCSFSLLSLAECNTNPLKASILEANLGLVSFTCTIQMENISTLGFNVCFNEFVAIVVYNR